MAQPQNISPLRGRENASIRTANLRYCSRQTYLTLPWSSAMEITNLDVPDDDVIEHLARLCECYGVFLDRTALEDEDTHSSAD